MNIIKLATLVVLIWLICVITHKSKFVNYIDPKTVELHPLLEGTQMSKYLKKHQNKLTEMFKEFIDICNNNDIEYIVIGGTLIGALRHKGWIPWDDDIDVAMFEDNQTKIANIYRNDPFLRQKYNVVTLSDVHVWINLYKIISKADPKCFIDIFLLKENGIGSNKYGYMSYKGYRPTTDIDNILPTKNAVFEEIPVKIPNNPLKLLRQLRFQSSGTPDINKLPAVEKRRPHHASFYQ